jgi:filamentous hemagglutinin family protein
MVRRCAGALTTRAILLAGVAATPLSAAAQPAATARPQGGQVVAGAAQISRTDALTRIDQSSQRAAIDWRSFDVGSGQSVTFQQPSASAVTLNRVTSADPSQIAGKITANGQVVLVNQSGVLFTKGAQVNAQSVIVSTAGITNQNFMAGQMVFDQPARPDAQVVNAGRITVKQAGLAALVAPQVKNAGMISARLGLSSWAAPRRTRSTFTATGCCRSTSPGR